jgi:hypothetical protein
MLAQKSAVWSCIRPGAGKRTSLLSGIHAAFGIQRAFQARVLPGQRQQRGGVRSAATFSLGNRLRELQPPLMSLRLQLNIRYPTEP